MTRMMTALLLVLASISLGVQAAPNGKSGKGNDKAERSQTWQGESKPAGWDDKEYAWWEDNCIDIKIGSVSLKQDCDRVDGKYREHYNRSIHSGNNPGRGHKK
ncbi:hypothetical protein ACFOSS_10520 [Pseudaeromonas sharmana]|uniref:Uncharacterized protein n=1 Tax=Pseudaeromonas sharmana TaxID=328412 RepID=A0ABV8CNV6_9GAMM